MWRKLVLVGLLGFALLLAAVALRSMIRAERAPIDTPTQVTPVTRSTPLPERQASTVRSSGASEQESAPDNPYTVTVEPEYYYDAPLADAAKNDTTRGLATLSMSSSLAPPPRDPEITRAIEKTLVTIAPGCFQMGSPEDEYERASDEGPLQRVCVEGFAIGRYEVTNAEYRRFRPRHPIGVDEDFDAQPVVNVSWNDAHAYARWLTAVTGTRYRLPSEAEWEYAARGNTTTAYWWGNYLLAHSANCDGCRSGWDGKRPSPVGSFNANPFGLYDTVGNVWEWVQDCWHDTYENRPLDGRAWLEEEDGDCASRVTRGGSYGVVPAWTRSAARSWVERKNRNGFLGFRIAKDP